jgi:hypothetical protein
MHDIDSEMTEWAEDICQVCGVHIGFGMRPFHLERCDEHSDYDDNEANLDLSLSQPQPN